MPVLETLTETKAAWEAFVRPRVASLMDPETDVLVVLDELRTCDLECASWVFEHTKLFYYMYEALRVAVSWRCGLTDPETGLPRYDAGCLLDVEASRLAGGFPSFDISDGPRALVSLYEHTEYTFELGGYWDVKIQEVGE